MRYVESLNKALHRLMKDDEGVLVLGEDIADPYGGAFKVTKGLSTDFPGRVMATPISEAGITGFATGLAINGFKPILEIMFGDFMGLCADQIINGASKFRWMYGEQFKVPLVIRTPMGGYRGFGPTHSQTLESLFLGVPGINIVAPSCYHNPGDLLYKTVSNNLGTPTLFIENKALYPEKLKGLDGGEKVGDFYLCEINQSNKDYPTISLKVEKAKPDITLIAYGGVSRLAVKAALNLFLEEEILVEVLIPSLIKPLCVQDVLRSVEVTGRVVIVEEGVKTGGYGSELGSLITENAYNYLVKPVFRIGAKSFPIPSSKYLEKSILPQQNDIESACKNLMK
jgi:pyruvate/2-oxoglutarate/acetoin dehydrogenase E1 component